MLRKFKTLLIGTALSITLIGAADAKWPAWQGQAAVQDILAPGFTMDADGMEYDLVQSSFDDAERAKVAALKDKKFGIALSPKKHMKSRPTQCDYHLVFTYKDDKDVKQTLVIDVEVQRQKHADAVVAKKINMDDIKSGAGKIVSEIEKIVPSIEAKFFSFIVPKIEEYAPQLIEMIIGKLDGISASSNSAPVKEIASVVDMVLKQIEPLIPTLTAALQQYGPGVVTEIFGAIQKLLGVTPSAPAVDPAPVANQPAVVPVVASDVAAQ